MVREIFISAVGDIITEPILNSVIPFSNNFSFVKTNHQVDSHLETLLGDNGVDFLISHLSTRYSNLTPLDKNFTSFLSSYLKAVQSYIEITNSFVIINTIPTPNRLFNALDHLEYIDEINSINREIIKLAKSNPFLLAIDLNTALLNQGISNSINIKNDLVMRMPYRLPFIKYLAKEYSLLINHKLTPRKKLILVDADNTLWGGILGEDGECSIQINFEYPGSIFYEFQKILKYALNSGILIGLVSKNNEQDIISAFNKLNMPLSFDDFITSRINWKPKSINIEDIAKELNIGLESIVFIDDNQFELDQVSSALPEVSCYKFDINDLTKSLFLLQSIESIFSWNITEEDSQKRKQYFQESLRKKELKKSISLEEYISSLNINITYGINRQSHIQRISQLTNKTNQFNLTTKRYSESEIYTLMESSHVYDFSVSDRFGDMGIVCVVIIQDSLIETFLVSCRALSRFIEDDILNFLLSLNDKNQLIGKYIQSTRNQLCSKFYENNNFIVTTDLGKTKTYSYPPYAQPKKLRYNFIKH